MPNAFTNFFRWAPWQMRSRSAMIRRGKVADRLQNIGEYLKDNIGDDSFVLGYEECYEAIIDVVAQVGGLSDKLFVFIDEVEKRYIERNFSKYKDAFHDDLNRVGWSDAIDSHPIYILAADYVSEGERFGILLFADKEYRELRLKSIFSAGLSILIYCLRSNHAKISSKNLRHLESLVGSIESRLGLE